MSTFDAHGNDIGVENWDFNRVSVFVTPERAEKLLARNAEYNRKKSDPHVNRLAEAMVTGAFLDSGSTISVDDTGKVIDGQHRLAACIKAGVPFRSIIISGLPSTAYTVTDRQKRRSLADTLNYHGLGNTAAIAALARVAHAWDQGIRTPELLSSKESPENVLTDYVLRNEDALHQAISTPPIVPDVVTGRVSHFIRLVTTRADENDSQIFCDILNQGVGSEQGLIVARDALMRDKIATASRGQFWQLGILLKTWNHWRAGTLSTNRAVLFVPGGAKANQLPDDLI